MGNKDKITTKTLEGRFCEAQYELNLSNEKMAELLDISTTMIGNYRNGKKPISEKKAMILSKETGWKKEYFRNLDCIYKTKQEEIKTNFYAQYELVSSVSVFLEQLGIYIYEPIEIQGIEIERKNKKSYVVKYGNNKYRKMTPLEYKTYQKKLCDYALFEIEHTGKPYSYDN